MNTLHTQTSVNKAQVLSTKNVLFPQLAAGFKSDYRLSGCHFTSL